MKSKRNLVARPADRARRRARRTRRSVAVAAAATRARATTGTPTKTHVVVERATTDTAIDNAPVGEDSIGDTARVRQRAVRQDEHHEGRHRSGQLRPHRSRRGLRVRVDELAEGRPDRRARARSSTPATRCSPSPAAPAGTATSRGTMDLHAIDATSFQFTFHVHHSGRRRDGGGSRGLSRPRAAGQPAAASVAPELPLERRALDDHAVQRGGADRERPDAEVARAPRCARSSRPSRRRSAAASSPPRRRAPAPATSPS